MLGESRLLLLPMSFSVCGDVYEYGYEYKVAGVRTRGVGEDLKGGAREHRMRADVFGRVDVGWRTFGVGVY